MHARDCVLRLLAVTRSVIASSVAQHRAGVLVGDVADRIGTPSGSTPAAAAAPPTVDTWLDQAVEAAPAAQQDLASALAAASPQLTWIRAYERLDSTRAVDAFRDHYAYTVLAGPVDGHGPPAVPADDLLVAFTLQAPHVDYPSHFHSPAEMYGVISGSADWQVGETWERKCPGDTIVHRSNQPHAMRTGVEPLLTWVVWPQDPHSPLTMPSLE